MSSLTLTLSVTQAEFPPTPRVPFITDLNAHDSKDGLFKSRCPTRPTQAARAAAWAHWHWQVGTYPDYHSQCRPEWAHLIAVTVSVTVARAGHGPP